LKRLRIGDWVVTPATNTLEGDERSTKLQAGDMELLMCLVDRAGSVVSIETLHDVVWHGALVADSAIYKRVQHLRAAFGDNPQRPNYIETIPKRGYRLIANVSSLPNAQSRQTPVAQRRPASKSRLVWLAAVISIAVIAALGLMLGNQGAVPSPSEEPRLRAYDHYVTGKIYLSRRSGQNQGTIAAAEFQRAIEIDPDMAPAYVGLAEVHYRENIAKMMSTGSSRYEAASNVPDDVKDMLDQAFQIQPDLPEGLVLLAQIAANQGDQNAALDNYRRALENSSNHVGALQGIALIMREQGNLSEAKRNLNTALAIEPRNPALLFDMMHVLDSAQEFEALMLFAEYAVTLKPDSISIYLWLNRYYTALGRPDKTLALLLPLVDDPRFNSEQVYLLLALSDAFVALGNISDARRYADLAQETGAFLVDSSFAVLLANGEDDEFIKALHVAVERSPWPWAYLAHLETLVGHYDHALAILEPAMADPVWNPQDTDSLVSGYQPALTAATIYIAMNQPQRASSLLAELRPHLEQATIDPRRRSGAFYALAAMESIGGNKHAALSILQQAVDSGWSIAWLLNYEPAFESLRSNPEYLQIQQDIRERMADIQTSS
jgi:DNA-binding winged helix-turn-helix (wHTH) protein/tetratricopeptide (TPR) repeat protein